ncbi:MAG: geranylgeranylglyceryl/heptaprenylglyceryl phosphate synthase [Flavobacterium sp.]|nr:geranylgeranylglyceryl/heptaprenylglyceryl phosphate synthase [Flavobacterium sp.]
MMTIYQNILRAKSLNHKLLAILIDPDKIDLTKIDLLSQKINKSPTTHIFIGGSSFEGNYLDEIILKLKSNTNLPIVLFPGNSEQISDKANGILFLSLISGRNPDYLIEHQVNAVPILKKINLEIISTGYILIESGKPTAVERVSQTKPLSRNNPEYILQTAQAGEMMGNRLIYLEAGSGADTAVPEKIISLVSQNISVPLIVGGGICSLSEIEKVYKAGADLVVIGTAFENDSDFFNPNLERLFLHD